MRGKEEERREGGLEGGVGMNDATDWSLNCGSVVNSP